MARQSLGDLLGNLDEKPAAAVVAAEAGEPELVQAAQPVAAPPKSAAAQPPRPTPSPASRKASELPTYLRLVRKETRLREDQQNQLTLEARRLNRAKTVGTPRITDNTLIRIAIDMLLDRVSRASGDDEASILRSLK
jgi:hypothetical protein